MQNANTKTIEKIRKLILKANDAGCTEEEAQAFLAKANQMLLKQNLTMSSVMAGEKMQMRHEESAFGYGKLYIEGNSWERTLLAVICHANLCISVIHPSIKEMSIIGRPDNVDVVKYMYEVARNRFREMSRTRYNAHKKEVLDEHDTGKFKRVELAKMLEQQKLLTYRTTFIQAYLKGAVMGLQSKLTLERMQAEADDRADLARRRDDGEDITAIIPLGKQLKTLQDECMKENKEFEQELYGDLKEGRVMKPSSERDAQDQGYQDGKNANFAKGVADRTERETIKQIG